MAWRLRDCVSSPLLPVYTGFPPCILEETLCNPHKLQASLLHMPPAENGYKPLLQSLLVADHCYRDALTGKAIVAGIYREIMLSPSTPTQNADGESVSPATPGDIRVGWRVGSPFAFLSFTEVYGTQEVVLRYATLDGNLVAFEAKLTMKAASPLEVVEAMFGLPPLPDRPGHYELAVLWENELLGSYRIRVLVNEPPTHQPPTEGETNA